MILKASEICRGGIEKYVMVTLAENE